MNRAEPMNMIFDLYQQFRIAEASTEASHAKSHSERTRLEVDELRRRLDSLEPLTLTCQALWEILRDQHGIPEGQLLAKMEEIDLRDGVADGKISAQTRNCPTCRRRSSARRSHCLYCGEKLSGPSGLPAGAP